MSDYTPVNDYSAKTGTAILGADIDDETGAIQTAVNSKYDSDDLASSGQAEAETANTVLMTPLRVANWADANGGMVGDIQALADPNADRILFWDDSAGAVALLTVGTGLSISTTTLATDDSAINHDALNNFVANEHVNHTSVTLTAGDGLSGGGNIAANRSFAVDSTVIRTTGNQSMSGTKTFSGQITLSGSAFNGGSASVSTDNDTADEFGWKGLPQVVDTDGRTFVLSDSGKMIYRSSDTGSNTYTIPPNSSVAFPVGTVIELINNGGNAITLAEGSGVTIIHAGTGDEGNLSVADHGHAVMQKVATNTWWVSGVGLS